MISSLLDPSLIDHVHTTTSTILAQARTSSSSGSTLDNMLKWLVRGAQIVAIGAGVFFGALDFGKANSGREGTKAAVIWVLGGAFIAVIIGKAMELMGLVDSTLPI